VGEIDSQKLRRWQRIATEAAEQSRRGRLPVIRPAVLFQSACEAATGLSLLPWEEEKAAPIKEILRASFAPPEVSGSAKSRPFSVNLFVGPEGGFTSEEASIARRYGITPVTLVPRILRAETAAIVATAAALYEAGEMS
jgi:16S rRNA (uracil1498-N3)-methyltransferase